MRKVIRFLVKKIINCVKVSYVVIASIFYFFEQLSNKSYMPFIKEKKVSEIIILGNGPSLNQIELMKLRNRTRKIACVNYFPIKHKEFFGIKPDYLCLFDPAFFDFIKKSEKEDYYELLKCLEKVDWDLKIVCPFGKKMNLKNEKIKYLWTNTNTNPFSITNRLIWYFYKKNILCMGCQNVVIGALYYFISCGFKSVFLAGVDMSEFKCLYVDKNNRTYMDTIHSYGSSRKYYDEMKEYNLLFFHQILGAYQKMFQEFYYVKEYAEKMGVDIINLSVDSYIDLFQKVDPLEFNY